MERLFLTVLSMSGTAAAVIVLVLLARLLLRRAPKAFSYALWAVVLFRLLCPVTIPSPWSLPPRFQVEPAGDSMNFVTIDVERREITVTVDIDPVSSGEETGTGEPGAEEPGRPAPASRPSGVTIASRVWLAGTALLLGYSAVSMLRLRRKLVGWVPLEGEKNVRLADHIPSPFVLGLVRPRVYLPSGLGADERDYVLLHERTHIRRGDHLFRALAWLALAVHWFNPLVWLAFHLAGKDMEMSCDETVLRKMGRDVRADYSASLLRLSQGGRLPAGPLAFGEGDPRSRIKNVLRWKKPALWAVAAALIVVVCAGAALATDHSPGHSSDPVGGPGKPAPFVYHEPGPAERWVDYLDDSEEMPWGRSAEIQLPEYPDVTFRWTPEAVSAITDSDDPMLMNGDLLTGMPVWNVYLCDLNGDGHRELYATVSMGSGIIDYRILGFNYRYLSFYELEDRMGHDYFLRLEGDQLWAVERDYLTGEVTREGPLVMTETGLDIRNTSVEASLPGADLTFTLDTQGEEPSVRIEGSVDGEPLADGVLWSPPHLFPEYPCGWLSMAYPTFDDGVKGHITAGWTDGSRTSVMISTQQMAALSSQFPAGYWTVTVALDRGKVTERVLHDLDEQKYPIDQYAHPGEISDEEAVEAARVIARLLTAAEDYYWNWAGEQDQP